MKSVKVKSRAQTKEPTFDETSHQEDHDPSFANNFIAEGRQQQRSQEQLEIQF